MKVFLLVLISLALAAKWQDDVLEIFNTQRHGYGLAPLQWEAVLEASALKSSQRCFVSLDVTSGHGEIVVRGFGVAEADAPKLMAALLVAEGQDWNCSADLCISGGCQHNRQIIWETTTQVGCGMTNCGSKGYELVCHFAPVGNIVKTHPLIKGPKSCPVPPETHKRTFGGYFQACSSICQGLVSACLSGWNSGGSSWGGGWSAPPGGSGWGSSWGSKSSGGWGGSGGWRLTQTENDATVLSYNALWAWWNKEGRSVMVDAGFDAEADGTVHPIPGQGFKGLEWTDEVLEIHNAERASFGVKPLKWDSALAAGAKTYAQACTLKPSLTRGLGESLAIGKGVDSRNAPKMLAAIWANEIFDWNCTTDKCSSGLCSHHRQMVWAETTKVGCGFASCSDGFALVCRYDVAGNVGSRHPLESMGANRCDEQPAFTALKKTRSVAGWGSSSWGGGCGNLLAACLSGYGLFSSSSWGGSTGGWSGSSGGSGWGSSGQGWGNSGWSSSGWNSGQSSSYSQGFRWGGESTSWGGGGASVCGGSSGGWSKRSWGSSSSVGWNSGSSGCGSSSGHFGKRSWGSSSCESSGWGSAGSLSWGGSTPDCGGWSNGQQGWGGGRAGWGSSSGGGGWRVEGSVGAQSFHIKMSGQTVQTRNPVLEWYNVDGRSARVDPGVETKEDGTVVALADSEVSGTHYIGALPRNTAIVVIVVCCVVGVLLLALVAAFIIKKRKPSYVDTV